MSEKKEFWTRDRIMWLIIGTLITIAVGFLIWYLSDVLLPFFAACLLAYLLNPLVERFMKWFHLRKRLPAVIITLLIVGGVLTGITYLCMPLILNEINTLSQIVKRYISHPDYSMIFSRLPWEWQQYLRNFNPEQLTSLISTNHITSIFNQGTNLFERSLDYLMKIIEWALMFIYILFILIDYDQIASGFKKIFPQKYRAKGMKVVEDVEKAMNSYFRGQGLVALCAAIMYSIGFTIVGLPLSLFMGLIVGILYMIPYFQYITLLPVLLLCFINSLDGGSFWGLFGECLLVYLITQSICDYILTPHIMGKEMGLNPAVILLALSVWGSLLGIIGMIIALPATALILSYYETYISNRE
ncbi:MAG: AI-2E family transporter [Muribaculaceae bacterium]|nr:AI-2E family transporter [Muribaculaceae bacterium]